MDTITDDYCRDMEWPLPNAEPATAEDFLDALFAHGPAALREIGTRNGSRVFTVFDEQQRQGVAVAVSLGTRETTFDAWASCRHDWSADHQRERSIYACGRCGHSYTVTAEG